ncbi:endonuclease NucS domain-containing protein [Celeribacter halophilus]|uniref:endonuclease NucS domain-containing protein n=1 Tax=Celeribacter halophilus TaxID=576117 RepID=UPI002FD5EB4C
MESSKLSRKFSDGIEVENMDGGLLVRQGDEAYVARKWQLSLATEELIETAIGSGLGCMIRDDHPRLNSRWPNPRGVVYLAFSTTSSNQWSLAIDTFNPARRDYSAAVFNGKYQTQFVGAGIPFEFESRNKGAGHLVVARQNVIKTLQALSEFDHSVLALNRTTHDGVGFTTEYVLQRQILSNWKQTPWGDRYDVVQDEFPVDGGLTSRRIDILARDRATGDWLIIELKRAEANITAVHQVSEYLLALGKRDDFSHGRLDGVLVAERISPAVRGIAANEGVSAYEASWPFKFVQVA